MPLIYCRIEMSNFPIFIRGGARKNSLEGVRYRVLSKKYELKCYKLKLFNLFKCYKPNVFQMKVIDRKTLMLSGVPISKIMHLLGRFGIFTSLLGRRTVAR